MSREMSKVRKVLKPALMMAPKQARQRCRRGRDADAKRRPESCRNLEGREAVVETNERRFPGETKVSKEAKSALILSSYSAQ